jgi:hypothetical protein
MSGSADEIARIENELDILRNRYALFRRGAEWVRWTLIAAGAVLAGLVLWRLILGDIFGAILVITFGVMFALSGWHYRRRRLIDLVSQSWIWIPTGGGTLPLARGGSEAREIEAMIAQREKRLAELRGSAT